MKLTLKNVSLSVGIFAFTLALVGVLSTGKAQASGCTAIASTDWATGSTWGAGCSGVGGVPTSADDVIIPTGLTVTVTTAGQAANTLTIQAAAAANGLTITSPGTLTVTGAVSMNAASGAVASTLAVGTGTLSAASLSMPASATSGHNTIVSLGATGTINITGSITFAGANAAQSQLTVTGAGHINLGGDFGNGATIGGTVTPGNMVLTLNGAGAQALSASTTAYYDVTLAKTGTASLTGTTTITDNLIITTGTLSLGTNTLVVTNTTNIASGGTLTTGANTTTLTQAVTLAGAMNLADGSTFTASNTTHILSGGVLTLAGTSGAKTFTGTFTVDAGGIYNETGANATGITFSAGSAIVNAGTATLNSGTHTISGTIANTGTFNYAGGTTLTTLAASTSGTVNYNGAAQTVQVIGYYNLKLGGSGTKVVGALIGPTAVINSFTIADGVIASLTGDSTVQSLTLGSVLKQRGSWGSSSSTATYRDNNWFAGTNKVTAAVGKSVAYVGDINPTPTTTTPTPSYVSTTPTTTTTTTTTTPGLIITSVPTTTTTTTTTTPIAGCTGMTGYSITTGSPCSTGSTSTTTTAPTVIAGCNGTVGFSTATGVSCAGNSGTTTTTTTTTGYNFGTTTLKSGSTGNAVMDLQKFLNAKLGLSLTADGKLGPKTVAAVKQWQAANGLTADGLVGMKTMQKMMAQ